MLNHNNYFFIFCLVFLITNYGFSQRVSSDPYLSQPLNELFPGKVNRCFIFIGSSRFSEKEIRLKEKEYIEKESKYLIDFFKSKKGGQIPSENIKSLINEEVSRSNIEKLIESVLSKADNKDIIIIYFTGKCFKEITDLRKNSFFTCDAYYGNTENDSYSFQDLITVLRKYNNLKNIITFFDLNPNPNIFRLAAEGYSEDFLQSSNTYPTKDTNYFLISSSSPIQNIYNSTAIKRSMFNQALIRGLEGEADKNRDNIVSIDELFLYISNNIKSTTQGRQVPIMLPAYNKNIPVSFLK